MFDLLVLEQLSFGEQVKRYISENLVNGWTSFLVQFLALVIMILVIFFVAYKPVKKMLTKRADYVENNIRESEESKAVAAKNASASEEALIASKKEAAEIIATAKENAQSIQKQSLEETQLEINKMKAQADEDIARSKEEAKEEIRKEMISVALSASEEVLKREINEEDNARIVEKFIEDIDN